MLRTIQRRLFFSQLIPLLIMLPVMGIMLIIGIESKFIIPKFANNLLGDARLLAEISSAEFELWGNPILFEKLISRVQLDPSIKVMFLDAEGRPLYSSDLKDYSAKKLGLSPTGIVSALSGEEIVLTNYSPLKVKDSLVDVYEPVLDSNSEVIGIVRLTYQVESLYLVFMGLRWQILLVLLAGLILSALISAGLANRISQPITRVTKAIYNLAIGKSHTPLEVEGPDELKSQAEAVNFLVAELESNEKARRQLLANLVHELGRPLGSIRSAIHALQNGADRDPMLYGDLTKGMDAETLRLQHLLNDLSHLYDQSIGALELNLREVDLNQWLPVVLRPHQAQAEEKGLRWSENLAPTLPVMRIDPERMSQVIGNLLNNAIKYTKSGGQISFSSMVKESAFQMIIEDSGVGIQPEEIEKVFQPFYRGEQGRRIKQGMGLGLSIARDLTTAHGGSLQISSQPDHGSRVIIKLPIEDSKDTPSQTP